MVCFNASLKWLTKGGIKARKVLTNELNVQRVSLVEQRKNRLAGVDAGMIFLLLLQMVLFEFSSDSNFFVVTKVKRFMNFDCAVLFVFAYFVDLRKKIQFDKRFEKESLLHDREHKYTTQMAELAGIDMDDLVSSRVERNFLWETKQILKNVPEDSVEPIEGEDGEEPVEEAVRVPMPYHMVAREVLWPIKFKDYEGKPDLWRTEPEDQVDRDDFEDQVVVLNEEEKEEKSDSSTSDSESSTSDGESTTSDSSTSDASHTPQNTK